MPDVQSLIESAEARGLRLFLAEGKVRVSAPQVLDGDTKAILQELREYRAEVESFLNEEDPILMPEHWIPHFRDLHHKVIKETPDFDYGWLRANRPDVYQSIKTKENELDALQEARLSEVMAIMRQWRGLILQAESERQGANEQKDR